jgi:hypothetical protein
MKIRGTWKRLFRRMPWSTDRDAMDGMDTVDTMDGVNGGHG